MADFLENSFLLQTFGELRIDIVHLTPFATAAAAKSGGGARGIFTWTFFLGTVVWNLGALKTLQHGRLISFRSPPLGGGWGSGARGAPPRSGGASTKRGKGPRESEA